MEKERFVKELERELERKGILVRREPVPVYKLALEEEREED